MIEKIIIINTFIDLTDTHFLFSILKITIKMDPSRPAA